jgi:hypothetical protein
MSAGKPTLNDALDQELSQQLETLLPVVLLKTGFRNVHSLNAKIGGKNRLYFDVRSVVVHSSEQFTSVWLDGFKGKVTEYKKLGQNDRSEVITYNLLKAHKEFQDYLFIFLKRMFVRYQDSLGKKKPSLEESEIWIGQRNANFGVLITPRFVNGHWENDKSEIRHFKPKYWTIGHIMETGLCVPGKPDKIQFNTIDQYLIFFRDVIVRLSGSVHENNIAAKYCEYVRSSAQPLDIPLLIPEFRYEGIDVLHGHRLDFTIIEPKDLNKIGFELSPWSTHGQLTKIKGLTQAEVNEIAKGNFEDEMKKHKDFFRKHGIFSLIYTDRDLVNIDGVFDDMKKYLEPKTIGTQIKLYLYSDFFKD